MNFYTVYSLLSVVVLLCSSAHGYFSCERHADCETCIASSSWWFGCRWCTLTNACHSIMSGSNDCSSTQQVTAGSGNCSYVSKPSPYQYDSFVAQEMAKWSSLAYVSLQHKDRELAKAAVDTYINPHYKIVRVLTSDCGMLMEGRDCAVVIAVSTEEKRIVVAFRGTTTNFQLFEEFLSGVAGFAYFEPTGGQVLSYFKEAHTSLYACVKTTLLQLLSLRPYLRVYVTGHSLGGAEAQLTAASLISEGIVVKSAVTVYTFGSPRVGDQEFAFNYDRMVGESWRVVHLYDPIPKIVPQSVMFVSYAYHTGREVYYDMMELTPNSNYTLCRGNEDDINCSGKDDICLTPMCDFSHLDYFVSSINEYMDSQIPDREYPSSIDTTTCEPYYHQK